MVSGQHSFWKKISGKVAIKIYKTFEWDDLVRILDEGGYVRYDFSTASRLLDI